MILQPGEPDDGLESLAGRLIEPLQTVVCQDAVLSSHGYQICGDADGNQVEEGFHPCERNGLAHGVCLYQLESHPATGQIIERVAAVGTFGVENGHCGRKLLVRKVVVADDHVHAEGFGIGYLLHGLYAAVQSYDKRVSVLVAPVDAFIGYAVALVVAVGDIVFDIGVEIAYKRVHQSHRRSAVHIIVSVDEHFLLIGNGFFESFHSFVHVLHQKRVMELGQVRLEELPGSFRCGYIALDK